jgi:hypothetical protein
LENEIIRVAILADKGTDIIEFLHKPSDTDFMWRSPMGIKNPALFVPTSAQPSGAFLDYYEGGWQEILPAGGDASNYKGAYFGVHGEVSLIPWQYTIIDDCPERVAVKFSVRTCRTPFFIEKILSLNEGVGVLSITEEVINEGQEEMDLMWGHHPAFGYPFLDESCVIDLAGAKVLTRKLDRTSRTIDAKGFQWPYIDGIGDEQIDLSHIPPPDAKHHDWACLSDLKEGWYAITNQKKGVGFGLVWPREVFPYIWYWQCAGGGEGAPFYGRVYTFALEPWSTYPDNIAHAVEEGTTIKLLPGANIRAEIKAVAYANTGRVSRLKADGSVIPG